MGLTLLHQSLIKESPRSLPAAPSCGSVACPPWFTWPAYLSQPEPPLRGSSGVGVTYSFSPHRESQASSFKVPCEGVGRGKCHDMRKWVQGHLTIRFTKAPHGFCFQMEADCWKVPKTLLDRALWRNDGTSQCVSCYQ